MKIIYLKRISPQSIIAAIKNYYADDFKYILFFLLGFFLINSFSGTNIIMGSQKRGIEIFATLSGLFILYSKDMVAAVFTLSASYYIFPWYFKAEPAKKVRSFEKLIFSLCLLITSLYLLNVFLIGQRKIESDIYYAQIKYIIPLQIIISVFIQQVGTNIFFLDLNRSRFGNKNGYLLTLVIFGIAQLPCFLFFRWYLAPLLIIFSTFCMAICAKFRIEYNSKLAPIFLHYLFLITIIYSFSLRTFLG